MAAADTQHPGSPGGITKITFISVMVEPSTADYGKRSSASTQRGIRLPAARWNNALYCFAQGVKTGEGGGWYLDHPPPGAGIKLCLNWGRGTVAITVAS